MIVRIATEGQYELSDDDADELTKLDNQAVGACEQGDDMRFRDVYSQLIEFVRAHGEPVGDDYLGASDLILPPPDASLEEAQEEFSGEGLIPG
jgi:hypothetical protein